MKNIFKKGFYILAALVLGFVTSCSDDDNDVTKIEGLDFVIATLTLEGTEIGVVPTTVNNNNRIVYSVDFGATPDDTDNIATSGPLVSFAYPNVDASYTISVTASLEGAADVTVTKDITITEYIPPAVGGENIVKGGNFEDADDHAEWTILNISASDAAWTFNDGSATIAAVGFNQQGIFQAIDVVAGKEYTIDMLVSGDGNDETWFEVFASTVEPVQESDYTSNVVMGLNTWDGCATGSFSGSLSSLGCVSNSYTDSLSNTVTFDTTGTIYLVIKCGGNQTSGITIENVEMRDSA